MSADEYHGSAGAERITVSFSLHHRVFADLRSDSVRDVEEDQMHRPRETPATRVPDGPSRAQGCAPVVSRLLARASRHVRWSSHSCDDNHLINYVLRVGRGEVSNYINFTFSLCETCECKADSFTAFQSQTLQVDGGDGSDVQRNFLVPNYGRCRHSGDVQNARSKIRETAAP